MHYDFHRRHPVPRIDPLRLPRKVCVRSPAGPTMSLLPPGRGRLLGAGRRRLTRRTEACATSLPSVLPSRSPEGHRSSPVPSTARPKAYLEVGHAVLNGPLRPLRLLLRARVGVVALRLRLGGHGGLPPGAQRLALCLPLGHQSVFPPLGGQTGSSRQARARGWAHVHSEASGRPEVGALGQQAAG